VIPSDHAINVLITTSLWMISPANSVVYLLRDVQLAKTLKYANNASMVNN
jgi:hypothetical protein